MHNSYNEEFVSEIIDLHQDLKGDIEARLNEFREIWASKDEIAILKELFFCILTPQSKATTCWGAIKDLECNDLLLHGEYQHILDVVGVVRFKYKKASYIELARSRFYKNGRITIVSELEAFKDPYQARNWLVEEVKGYGMKEASHFLRNIGLGEELAILDRHILKNLVKANVITEVPSSLTKDKYLKIETAMKSFSDYIGIRPSQLDLMLWYKEAGTIFK